MHKIDQSNLDIFAVAPRAGAGIEIKDKSAFTRTASVAPRAGAGIEITLALSSKSQDSVAPRAGAGIEIKTHGEHLRNG